MSDETKDVFLMKRSQEQILDDLNFTESTEKFLSNCQPSYGNLIYNEKRRNANDAEIIGFARLPDGTGIRIEGVTKLTPGKPTIMPVRVVVLPWTMFNGKEQGITVKKSVGQGFFDIKK